MTTTCTDGKWAVIWPPSFSAKYIGFATNILHLVASTCFRLKRLISNTGYPVMCKVYTNYQATSKLKHGSSAYTVDNPLAGLSYRRTNHAISLTEISQYNHSLSYHAVFEMLFSRGADRNTV